VPHGSHVQDSEGVVEAFDDVPKEWCGGRRQDHVVDVEEEVCRGTIPSVDKQGCVHLGLDEAETRGVTDESIKPRAWCLAKPIERTREEADVVRPARIDEARGLLAVHMLL